MAGSDSGSAFVSCCPHLGLGHDPSTRYMFVTNRHRCYLGSSAMAVPAEQQAAYCLSAGYRECPRMAEALPQPPEQGRKEKGDRFTPRNVVIAGGVIALIVMLAAFLSWERSGAAVRTAAGSSQLAPQSISSGVSTDGRSAPSTSSVRGYPPPAPPDGYPGPTPANTPPTGTAIPAVGPGASGYPAARETASPSPIGLSAQDASQRGQTIHIVQQGDTLSGLAKRYDVTTEEIMKANGLENRSYIWVGQRLVIPGPHR